MWIKDVEFPDELIEAHQDGRLVLFVGAGASMDPPSDLPSFKALAEAVARDAAVEFTGDDATPLDGFLGDLDDDDVNVHERVRAHVDKAGSIPNRMHHALARLAANGPRVRVVTTNYDSHLSTALQEENVDFDEYLGPALPLGDDFEGVVYLHGNLAQEARRLVVTDRDFGHAYLREAWAGQFLDRMFSSDMTVLFVGYSHSDVVMSYLARALGPDSSRYALADASDPRRWRSLGINHVKYQTREGSHLAAAEAMEGWADQAGMGLLDHRHRLEELLSSTPSQVPEDVSYLESTIKDPQRVRLFTEISRGAEWLGWAATQPNFQQLFDPGADITDAGRVLARWFADHFVADPELSEAALELVHATNGQLGAEAWHAVLRVIHHADNGVLSRRAAWAAILLQNIPAHGQDLLEYCIRDFEWPADRSVMLLLLDHFLSPVLVPRRFSLMAGAKFEVALTGSGDALREIWANRFLPHLSEAVHEVMSIVDRHLRRAYLLQDSAQSTNDTWDWISGIRSAVGDHPANLYGDPFEILIEVARDCLVFLQRHDSTTAQAFSQVWARSGRALLQRLALHAWTVATADERRGRLGWVTNQGWVYTYELRQEIYQFVRSALPSASPAERQALIEAAVKGPQDVEEPKSRDHQRFQFLTWILDVVPDELGVREAVEELSQQYPRWTPVDEGGPATGIEEIESVPSPLKLEALHERIVTDPAGIVRELMIYDQDSTFEEQDRWEAVLNTLTATVKDYPQDGTKIFPFAKTQPQLLKAVAMGWALGESFDQVLIEDIVRLLEAVDLDPLMQPIAMFLAKSGARTGLPPWHTIDGVAALARKLWEVLPREQPQQVNDWSSWAINDPAGCLTQFWIRYTAGLWQETEQGWEGLPLEVAKEFSLLLRDPDDIRTKAAEVILASELHFFLEADRTWTLEHLLPSFDCGDPSRVQRAWAGHLLVGRRLSTSVLEAGLLEHYANAGPLLPSLPERHRQVMLSRMASIAVSAPFPPEQWLKKFVSQAEEEYRVSLADQITIRLRKMSPEEVEKQWRRWIHGYWQNRVYGIPRTLTEAEASALTEWAVYLTESLEEGVGLACQHPAGFHGHRSALRDIEGRITENNAALYLRLIIHLLSNTPTDPMWPLWGLNNLVGALKFHATPEQLHTLSEEGIRLGLSGANRDCPTIE